MKSNTSPPNRRIFLENPYDVETLVEAISIATSHGKELVFLDRVVATVRADPLIELADLCYLVLHDMELIRIESTEKPLP